MPFVHRFLVALRTLIEDDPKPRMHRHRRHNSSRHAHNARQHQQRHGNTMLLSFRDVFTSDGLNMLLDELEGSSRRARRLDRGPSSTAPTPRTCRNRSLNQVIPCSGLALPDPAEETVPLLPDEASESLQPAILFPSGPLAGGFWGSFPWRRRRQEATELAIPLDPVDEDKTIRTLRKALKWSSKKQSSVKFCVPLPPREEGHKALAVVQNAVNTVKEEQGARRKKFRWMRV